MGVCVLCRGGGRAQAGCGGALHQIAVCDAVGPDAAGDDEQSQLETAPEENGFQVQCGGAGEELRGDALIEHDHEGVSQKRSNHPGIAGRCFCPAGQKRHTH